MASGEKIVGLIIALVVAVTLFTPIVSTVDTNTGTQSVTNETVTADVGNFTDLSGFYVVDGSETVYWLNSSTGSYETVSASIDYEIDNDPGKIKALASGSIEDGDSLKVSYDYQASDDTTTTVLDLVPLLVAVLLLGVMGFHIRDKLR